MSERTLVLPPLGPLFDLHPELRECERRLRDGLNGELLDLEALPDDPLSCLVAAAGQQGAVLTLAAGPFGRDLRDRVRDTVLAGNAAPVLDSAPAVSWAGLLEQSDERLCAWRPGGDAAPRRVSLADALSGDGCDGPAVVVLRDSGSARELLECIGSDAWRARRAGLLPLFVSASHSEVGPTPDWAFGLILGDGGAEARACAREIVRRLFPDRLPRYLALEHGVLSGADLQADRLAVRRFGKTFGRRPGTPSSLPTSLPPVVAICGIDGAGKSRHVRALAEHAARRGLDPGCFKLFRHGVFHETVTALTRRCAGGRRLELWRLQRQIKLVDTLKAFHTLLVPAAPGHDVLILDRYVPTHRAAASGRLLHAADVDTVLAELPRPCLVVLLDLPAEVADARIGARDERTVDEHLYMMARYRDALLDQADREGFVVLDGMRPFEENRAAIAAAFDQAIPGDGSP